MFCTKCGKEIPENSAFCTSCGAEVANNSQPSPSAVNSVNSLMDKVKTLNKKTLMAICGVAVALVLVIILAVTAKPTINLNDYATITFSGYDTVGYAHMQIDYDALEADLIEKLGDDPTEFYYIVSSFQSNIGGTLDNTSNLSNGDTVKYTWSCNEEFLENTFKCKVKYSDIKEKVSGLEKIETFDPFSLITVKFTGISPDGYASIERNNEDDFYLSFSIDNNSDLSNGDVVTVTLDTSASYLAEEYGKAPTATEKEYTVAGLESYVSSLSQINEKGLADMKQQAEDAYKAYTARSWNSEVTLKSMEYLGSYLLTNKNHGYYYINNKIVLVYKVIANVSLSEYSISEDVTYYTCVTFTNATVASDETLNVNLTDYSLANDSYRHTIQYGENSWNSTYYYFNGYETLDVLYANYVTSYIDNYAYESSVETETAQ